MALYEESKEDWKSGPKAEILESTRLSQLFDEVRVQVVQKKESLVAKESFIQSIVEGSSSQLDCLSKARLKVFARALISW